MVILILVPSVLYSDLQQDTNTINEPSALNEDIDSDNNDEDADNDFEEIANEYMVNLTHNLKVEMDI